MFGLFPSCNLIVPLLILGLHPSASTPAIHFSPITLSLKITYYPPIPTLIPKVSYYLFNPCSHISSASTTPLSTFLLKSASRPRPAEWHKELESTQARVHRGVLALVTRGKQLSSNFPRLSDVVLAERPYSATFDSADTICPRCPLLVGRVAFWETRAHTDTQAGHEHDIENASDLMLRAPRGGVCAP